MPVTRKDLTFYTTNQLAGAIRNEWHLSDYSEEVHVILTALSQKDEPHGTGFIVVAALFELLLPHLSDWQCAYSDNLIKEIKSRVTDYRQRLTAAVTDPVPFVPKGLDAASIDAS